MQVGVNRDIQLLGEGEDFLEGFIADRIRRMRCDAKAKAIISYRESKGGFKSLDELDNVKGFGKASIEKLKADLEVGAAKAKK